MVAVTETSKNMDASIKKAAAAIRTLQSCDDLRIYEELTADGVEPSIAARLIEFLPMAYCRLLLESKGVQFSNKFQRRLSNGRTSEERLLSSEPVWNAIVLFARNELRCGVSSQDLLAIAGRSAEFDAINKLLNNGSKPDIVLDPVVFAWPKNGPINEH